MSFSQFKKAGKTTPKDTSGKRRRHLSYTAINQFYRWLSRRVGGISLRIFSKVSERGSIASSSDDGESGTSDWWGAADSTASQSSFKSIPPWDPLDIPPPLEEYVVLPTVSFSTPLPPPESLKRNWHGLDVGRHQFLLSFLHQERYMDIPFGTAHRLINYIMHLAEEAAFDFVKRHIPDYMEIKLDAGESKWADFAESKWADVADDVEIQFWVKHIMKHHRSLEKHMVGGGIVFTLKQLRLNAVHSWVYDTYQIKTAAAFLAILRDEQRLTALEQVLRVVYLTHQETSQPVVTDAERHLADVALGYIPTEPRTVHQALCRPQELLERACYSYWAKYSPQRLTEFPRPYDTEATSWFEWDRGHGWDCPERVELNLWDNASQVYWNFEAFPHRGELSDPDKNDMVLLKRLLNSATCLRHAAAHRRVQIGEYTLDAMFTNAQRLAELLEDKAASEEIRDKLRPNKCWHHIREEQREETETRIAARKESDEEERVKWQVRVWEHILEDSLLLRPQDELLTCEIPLDGCAME